MKANVVFHSDAPLKDLGGGVSRRVLAHTDQLMIVEVNFEAGGVGSVHTHPHCQNTCVRSGRFRFVIDGEPAGVGPGDTLAFPRISRTAPCASSGACCSTSSPRCARISCSAINKIKCRP